MRHCNNAVQTDKSIGSEVGNVASHAAVCECVDDSLLVNQGVSCEVQQAYSLLHGSDSLCVDHSLCVRQCGNVQGDIVALLEYFLVALYVMNLAGELQSVLNGEVAP